MHFYLLSNFSTRVKMYIHFQVIFFDSSTIAQGERWIGVEVKIRRRFDIEYDWGLFKRKLERVDLYNFQRRPEHLGGPLISQVLAEPISLGCLVLRNVFLLLFLFFSDDDDDDRFRFDELVKKSTRQNQIGLHQP